MRSTAEEYRVFHHAAELDDGDRIPYLRHFLCPLMSARRRRDMHDWVRMRRFRSRISWFVRGRLTSLDSAASRCLRRESPGRDDEAANQALNGTNRKQSCRTMACGESLIAAACYLCNTLSKTACSNPFRAVPLLLVQVPSVIVMLRRRGASRGRPVLGGSLKSLAFMRECPKARSG